MRTGCCCSIARRFVENPQDVEECLSNTWFHAWNAIPPHRPRNLAVFLGKITRELALDRWKAAHRKKRGGEAALALEELEEIAGAADVERAVESKELAAVISGFLRRQPELHAALFVERYYHLRPLKELTEEYGIGESRAKSLLFRMRKRLKAELEKEGYL